MRKLTISALAGVAGVALVVAATAQLPVGAAPTNGVSPAAAETAAHRPDNRPGPLTKQWIEKRRAALDLVARGKAKVNPNGTVTIDAETNNVVEVAFEKTDKIFTILSEFGTQSAGKYGTVPGPLHNQIPQPDRATDNSTSWTADFNRSYYE